MTYPSVYPTGATIYDPDRCWNGYTIFRAKEVGALLIDMNGGEVQLWKKFHGMPNRILPGGYLIGSTGERNTAYGVQDSVDLFQVDWDGHVVWRFREYEYIEDPGETPQWMARQHHDYQREVNPVGYYVPGMDPLVDRGNTVILSHKNLKNPKITDKLLLDDTIIEVTPKHEIVWEYISPYWGTMMKINLIYRAYRVPYDWVPQVAKPEEKPIERLDVTRFRVPGASPRGPRRVVGVEGVLPYRPDTALRVLTGNKRNGSK